MALEKSKLIVEIETNTKNTSKDINRLSDEFSNLSDEAKLLENQFSSLTPEVQKQISQYLKMQHMLVKNNNEIKNINQATQQNTDIINQNSIAMDDLAASIDQASNSSGILSKIFGLLKITGGSLAIVLGSLTLSGLIGGLERATMATGLFVKSGNNAINRMVIWENAFSSLRNAILNITFFMEGPASKSFATFMSSGTVGAARVNIFRQTLFDLQYAIEILSVKINKTSKYLASFFNSNINAGLNTIIKYFDAATLSVNKFAYAIKFGMVNELYFGDILGKLAPKLASLTKTLSFFGAISKEAGSRFLEFIALSYPAMFQTSKIIGDIALMMSGSIPFFSMVDVILLSPEDIKTILASYTYVFSTIRYYVEYFVGYLQKSLNIVFSKMKFLASDMINLFKSMYSVVYSANTASMQLLGTFSKAGTAGAARVNLLNQTLLDLQYAFEIAYSYGVKFTSMFPKILKQGMDEGVKIINRFVVFFKTALISGFSNIDLSSLKSVFSQIPVYFNNAIGFIKTFGISIKNATSNSFIPFVEQIKNGGFTLGKLGTFIKEFGIGFKAGFFEPIIQGRKVFEELSQMFSSTGKAMSSFANIIKSVFHPSVATITKSSVALGPIFSMLGYVAITSENAFVKLSGIITLVAVAAFASLASVLTLFLDKIGAVIEAIGTSLINAMTKFEEKSTKMQSVTKMFEFTLTGFVRTLGVDAVGSLDMWNEKVDEMAKTTSFSMTEIRTAIKLMVAEGSSLKLPVVDMVRMLETAANVASITGNDIDEVIRRFVQGLTGQSQSLITLGINVTEHALMQSELAKEYAATGKELTETQKQQLRLNEIYKQTIPIMGAAENKLNTIEGATKQYNYAIDNLQASLGQQGIITLGYTKAISSLAKIISDFPQPLMYLASSFLDLGGVLIKVFGTFTRHFILVSSLVTITKVFNTVLGRNGLTVNILNKAFDIASSSLSKYDAALKASIISNTSLSIVFRNTALVMKSFFIASFAIIIKSMKEAASAVAGFSKALMMNPLFVKGSALFLGLSAAVFILDSFKKEIKFLIDITPLWAEVLIGATVSFYALSKAIEISAIRSLVFNKTVKALIATIYLQTIANYGSITSFGLMATSVNVLAVSLMSKLKVAFVAVIGVMRAFTVAVLMNPLFIKAVAIAAAISALAQGIYELSARFESLKTSSEKGGNATSQILADVEKQLFSFSLIWDVAKATIIDFWQIVVEAMKMVIMTFNLAYKGIEGTWIKIKSIFSGGLKGEKINDDLKKWNDEAKRSAGIFAESFQKVVDIFSGVEKAIAETSAASEKLNDDLIKTADRIAAIQDVKAMEMGDEFEKARLSYSKTIVDIEKLKREISEIPIISSQAGEGLAELQKKLDEKVIESASAFFKMEKLKLDTLDEFSNRNLKNEIERLKSSNKFIEAAKMENKIASDEFEKTAKKLRSNIDMSKQQVKVIQDTRKALEQQNAERIKVAQEEQNKADYSEYIKQYDELINKTREWNAETIKLNETKLDGINKNIKEELEGISKIKDAMLKSGMLTPEKSKVIGDAEKAAKEAGDARIKEHRAEISGEVGSTLQSISGFVADAGSLMGGTMQGVASQIASFASSTTAGIIGVILKIPTILNTVSGLIDEITNFPKTLMKAVKGLFTSVIKFVSDFIPNVINLIMEQLTADTDFMTGIADAFTSLVDNLPILIDKFAERIPELVQKFIKASILLVPKLVVAIVKMILVSLPKIIVSLVKMIPELIKAMIEGIIGGLKEAVNLFKGINPFGEGTDLNKAGKKLAETFNKNSQMFQISDLGAGVSTANEISRLIDESFKKGVDWLTKAWHKILAFFDELGTKIWKGLMTEAAKFAEWIGDVGTKIWKGLVKAATEAFEWLKEIGTKIWNGLAAAATAAFEWLKTIGSKIWDGLAAAATAASEWITGLGTKIWDGLNSGLQTLGTFFTDLGTNIWNGLKSGLDTLGKFFSDMFNSLNVGSMVSKLFADPNPGPGFVEGKLGFDIPFLNFARGTSRVPGTPMVPGDSEANDKVMAMLSPGEAVIPRSLMANPMIKALVESILRSQGSIPKMSLGGFVKAVSSGDLSGAVSEAGSMAGLPKGGFLGDLMKGDVNSALKQLDPTQLKQLDPSQWKALFFDKVIEGVKGVLLSKASYDNGGMVSRDGMATLHAGEIVLAEPIVERLSTALLDSKKKETQGGVNNINVTFDIKTTQPVDDNMIRNKLWPEFKKMLRRESLDGRRLIETTGIG